MEFTTKDSGKRTSFDSGMVRDTTEGKTLWHKVADGPLLKRWAELLTRGAQKYPDEECGKPNWMKASGEAEYQRFRESAFRHFMQWYTGDRSEDHAAAVMFNLNGAEYVNEQQGTFVLPPLEREKFLRRNCIPAPNDVEHRLESPGPETTPSEMLEIIRKFDTP